VSLAPELADRLAKLLRLACSNGPDGEKLAAVGRLMRLLLHTMSTGITR
jgi:hypothetical protein